MLSPLNTKSIKLDKTFNQLDGSAASIKTNLHDDTYNEFLDGIEMGAPTAIHNRNISNITFAKKKDLSPVGSVR